MTNYNSYVIVAAVVGLYALPWIKDMKPKANDTDLMTIAGNIVIFLLMSSSFPVVAWVLGLTSFDLIGYYENMYSLTSLKEKLGYRLLFTIFLGMRYTKLFYSTLVVMFRTLLKILFGIKRIISVALKSNTRKEKTV
jgi:hypothetical protein